MVAPDVLSTGRRLLGRLFVLLAVLAVAGQLRAQPADPAAETPQPPPAAPEPESSPAADADDVAPQPALPPSEAEKARGLRVLKIEVAGNRRISRSDVLALTEEAAKVSGIPYVMDAYREEAEQIISG